MKAAAGVEAGYVDAVARLFKRIEPLLEGVDDKLLPLGVYIAGGAAAFFHAGSQASRDIDASFSLRVQLPDDLEETYIDRDGSPASVYLDPRYNDTLGPLHEDALQDAEPLELPGIDRHKLDIRVLAPVDLAISMIAMMSWPWRARGCSTPTHSSSARWKRSTITSAIPAAPRVNLKDAVRLIRANTPAIKRARRSRQTR